MNQYIITEEELRDTKSYIYHEDEEAFERIYRKVCSNPYNPQTERERVLSILEKRNTECIERAIIDQRQGALGSTLRISIHKQSIGWIEELREGKDTKQNDVCDSCKYSMQACAYFLDGKKFEDACVHKQRELREGKGGE